MEWQSKLFEKRFYYLVGLAGVDSTENAAARRTGSIFSGLMVLVAMVLLVEWQWQLLREIKPLTSFVMNWFVFMFFVVAFLCELLLVKKRWRFIGQNWALPIIIFLGIPFLVEYKPLVQPLSALRPLLAIYVLFPSLRTLISFFFDGDLRTTVLGAAVVIVIFGLLVAGVDPAVKSVWDGIWWAIATVATIGYGDVVPSSALGRLLGVILVVLGVAIFVIITANILAYTLKKDRKTIAEEEEHIQELVDEVRELKEMQKQQNEIMKKMHDKLDEKDK
jgi:voltage-gated potassium channel